MGYGVRVRVRGERALFTRPEMKAERVSYDVITPSAARAIVEALHWKPAIRWHVDRIRVLRPIRFETIRRNEVGSKISSVSAAKAMKAGTVSTLGTAVDADRVQRAALVLRDVEYIVDAHLTLTTRAGSDDSVAKHLDIFHRRARRGQCFQQPCLGVREFEAEVSLVDDQEPMSETHPSLAGTRELGWMLHDIDYDRDATPRFFRASMIDGVVEVPPWDSSVLKS